MARHLYACAIRWSDMDIYGVVNNVAFLRYLEESRIDFLFRAAADEGGSCFEDGAVVVRHEIDYRRQLVHRHHPVDIEIWVSQLQSATVTMDYRVMDSDTVYAVASTVMAPFDYGSGRPRRLTEAESDFFEKYLEAPVPSSASLR